MKKMKTVVLVMFLALSLATWVQAGKGGSKPGSGGGGGNGGGSCGAYDYTYWADFTVDNLDSAGNPTDLNSDGGGPYYTGEDSYFAGFVGSGNPLLKLECATNRSVSVNLSGCTALDPQDSDTVALLNDAATAEPTILGISPYGTVDENGQSVDGNFLGLGLDQTGYTLLGMNLKDLQYPDGRPVRIRFDPAFGSDLAEVTRNSNLDWSVNTLGKKASIVVPVLSKSGRSTIGTEVVATCEPLYISYSVACYDDDGDGICDPAM